MRTLLPLSFSQPSPYSALLCLLCAIAMNQAFAQAPGPTVTGIDGISTDGTATQAKFAVNLSTDNGQNPVDTATAADSILITGRIVADANDVNSSGNLYILIAVGADFYMQTVGGGFELWNGELSGLKPALEDIVIEQSIETTIFSGILGIPVELNVFLAYSPAGTNKFVYSSAPTLITLTEAGEPGTNGSVFYTPAPVVSALQESRSPVWRPLTSAGNLTHFSFGNAASGELVSFSESASSIATDLGIVTNLLTQQSATNSTLLKTVFEMIEESDNQFRLMASKHSNYAVSVDPTTNQLILSDIRSGSFANASPSYLLFSISNTNSGTLTATARTTYDLTVAEFVTDPAWVSQQVLIKDGLVQLSSSESSLLTFYESPIDLSIPFDFNPDQTARVSNLEVPPIVKLTDDVIARTPEQVDAKYAEQLSSPGSNTSTTAAATVMLAEIEQTLSNEDSQLRYPPEFYLAFREGLFARRAQSLDSTDGIFNQLTVPYVYFTNEADSNGIHHPFMVIGSYGIPDGMALLWDVPRPPGDGLGGMYEDQNVTRSYHREAFLMKIPLRDYGEVETLTENIMVNDLASDTGISAFDHHNYASVSATGVAVDGVIIYPSYNNALAVAQSAAELSARGMHSGRGLGVHYHADAHSATDAGLNLYNRHDYVGRSHPPIVSMGFDGVAGYGVYADGDTSSDGVGIPLDDFGGHEHDAYAYHYHSFKETETSQGQQGPNGSNGVNYTAHKLPPLGAWSGRINDIPEFWQGPSPNYSGGRSVYLGTE